MFNMSHTAVSFDCVAGNATFLELNSKSCDQNFAIPEAFAYISITAPFFRSRHVFKTSVRLYTQSAHKGTHLKLYLKSLRTKGKVYLKNCLLPS